MALAPPASSAVRATFPALYDDHVDLAWRVLARLGVAAPDLEDAVQDVFIVAHRRLAQFRGDSKLSTWVTGIAVRVAHDYRRRDARKPAEPLEPHEAALEDRGVAPDDAVSRAQAGDLLATLLARLEPSQREVFVLAELEQLSAPEIAELMGTPVNTVYSRLRLARERFNEGAAALRGEP
ncbi:MAG: sigma-70 family RNA polymerase sigma factor [Myxococcaceae bacterium]|nr:sigma-70 family RNA polymerase sigma factor [Myxococcaceae bacterium]